MSNDDTIKGLPENSQPVNTQQSSPLEKAVEEAKSGLYSDADIITHAQKLVTRYLEEARSNEFKVELSYTDLRLIADSVNLALSRTDQVNRLADILDQRMQSIQEHTQQIHNISSIRLTNNEKD